MVIHHGGAGTSQSAAEAGVPSVVVPFTEDQPFWASRLQRAGVAPQSVPYKHLSSDLLPKRIMEASSPGVHHRAEVLGRLMRDEQGVQNAVSLLERLVGRCAEASVFKS